MTSKNVAQEWIVLEELRPGAIFETRTGVRAVKSEYRYPYGGIECVLLASGEAAHFSKTGDRQEHNGTEVREVDISAERARADESADAVLAGIPPVHPRAIAARRIKRQVIDALRRAGITGAKPAESSAAKRISDAADAMERKAIADGESVGARAWTRIEAYRECAALAAEGEGEAIHERGGR